MTTVSILSPHDTILVTGSSGFIGSKVVETLLGRRLTNIRCLVRSSSRLGRLESVLDKSGRDARVEIVVDRLKVAPDSGKPGGLKQRLAESFETALRHAEGRAVAVEMDSGAEHLFSARFACPVCGYELAGINGTQLRCPSCSEPLKVEKGKFYRLTPPGTVDVEAIDVSVKQIED